MRSPLRSSILKGLALGGAAFLGGACATLARGPHAVARNESPYAIMEQLGRVLVEVENSYVEPVDRTKLINGAIKGMVAELDPHSSYMPADEYALFQSDTEGKFGGVGVEVDGRHDTLVVIAPIEGSPAERAGIRSGDRIIGIDGNEVSAIGLDKLVRKMRGEPGTHIKLIIKRKDVQEPLIFDLVREIIRVPSIRVKMLEGGVGYIRLKQFQEKTHQELLRAASQLKAAKTPLRGVLFDMRSNPGGLVDQAAEVADEFLSEGTILTTRHRGEIIDDVRARRGGAFSEVPVVILVNEWSASAAELVAGALQDHKRALVVGTTTFGKGSVQEIVSLPDGAGLRLTIARYYTPSGRSIQAEGVHPDISVNMPGNPDLPVLRERDLEGHLAPQGPKRVESPAAKPDAGSVVDSGAAGAADAFLLDAQNIPADPRTGKDEVLRAGYEALLIRIAKGPVGHP